MRKPEKNCELKFFPIERLAEINRNKNITICTVMYMRILKKFKRKFLSSLKTIIELITGREELLTLNFNIYKGKLSLDVVPL